MKDASAAQGEVRAAAVDVRDEPLNASGAQATGCSENNRKSVIFCSPFGTAVDVV